MSKTTNQPQIICAIDASTNSIAFAFYSYKNITQYGKINFDGGNIYEKVIDATAKVKAFFEMYNKTEAIVIEHTVFMNSPKTAADLALVQGAILGGAGLAGVKIIGRVSPITWQSYLTIKLLDVIYDKKIEDNDVADAAGIGHWAVNNWDKAVKFDKE